MKKDIVWKVFFSDNERYADLINGIGCLGKQVVHKDDLQELDTQTDMYQKMNASLTGCVRKTERRSKSRDIVRKIAFGANFAVVGIENQEEQAITIVRNMLKRNMSLEDICALAECSEDFVKKIQSGMQ